MGSDDADERNKDNKKGGFTWIEKRSYAGLSDEELDLSSLTDEEPDWYDDRYDPSAQACQTTQQVAGYWADYAGSIEMDEPQREIIERGLQISEVAEIDVDRLAKLAEQQANMLEQHDIAMKEEFERDREPIPLLKRIVNSILDDIPVTIFWFLVSAGLILLSLLF